MRDTSDMMEDALSEDTMMDCGGDGGGLEDFVDLATDITDNSPTIRDAAERLLTLLGVDDGDEDLASSSEDEGVEVDIDDLENDDEETGNTRLLHHLAASLAQELKYSSTRSSPSSSGRAAHQSRGSVHCVEMLQDTSYLERGCLQDQAEPKAPVHQQSDFFARSGQLFDERSTASRTKFLSFEAFRQGRQEPTQHSRSFEPKDAASHAFPGYVCLDQRLRAEDQATAQADKYFGHQQQQQQDTDSWAAGWDACANEALRYLIEDEGLPLHHPTVIAMKNHLDLQKERVFAQHTGYTEAKSQDMNLALD